MTDGPRDDAPRIVGGSPTEEETAAIAAVFAQLLMERAARAERIPPPVVRSTWDRTRRALRRPKDTEGRWDDVH